MKYPFTHIIIIYNPNSTGNSEANAKHLYKQLRSELAKATVVDMVPTKHAGHAEELALKYASRHKKLLIISASGDGGYNEVINGIAASKNASAVSAVLPSGNANDHHRAVSHKLLIDRILQAKTLIIDGIRVSATVDGRPWIRYAHSYVGLGLTAYIGRKLTEASLNRFNEKWLVFKYLLLFRNVSLKVAPDLRWHHYSSVIFSNLSRMSKVIKLAPEAALKDERIEVYYLRTHSFLRLLLSLIFASTIGLRPSAQLQSQTIVSERPIEIQLDGEVQMLDANRDITVSVANSLIRTLC